MTDAERLPIVLCCAEELEVALNVAVDALYFAGFGPEVVSGVDGDAGLLTAATDRVRGEAIFVLCQSDDLDRVQIRRLQGLFSARKGPNHQLTTVDVQAMGAMAIIPAVRVLAEGYHGSAYDPDDDAGPQSRHFRDEVNSSGLRSGSGGSESEPTRRPAASPAQGAADPADARDPEPRAVVPAAVAPARKVYPEPDDIISTDPTGSTLTPYAHVRFEGEPSDGVPTAVPTDDPRLGDSTPPRPSDGVPGPVAYESSGQVDIERVVSWAVDGDPRAEADSRPLPTDSAPVVLTDPPSDVRPTPVAAVPPGRSIRIGLLLVAAAGMASVIAMAVMHASAPVGIGPPGPSERGVPERSTQAPVRAIARPAAKAAPTAAPGVGSRPSAHDPSPQADHGRPPKSVPPPPTLGTVDSTIEAEIDAAVADGRLEVHDDLLVIRGDSAALKWNEAMARCRRRRVDSLRGWRLPSKGQLVKLRRAKLVKEGSYWSRTKVGGDEAYAYDASTGRMNVWRTAEADAQAICVRRRE